MHMHSSERESHIPTRRQALCLAAAIVAVPAGVVARAATPDPILARIAEHQRLMEPVRALKTITEADEDRLASLLDIADAQFSDLLSTVPTTIKGLHALVSYVQQERTDLPLGMRSTPDGYTEESIFLDTLSQALGSFIKETRA